MIIILIIMLYGIVYTLSEMLSESLGVLHIITVPSMLVYWCILIHSLKKHNLAKVYYICAPENKKVSHYFVYAPLLLMSMVNMILFFYKFRTMNIVFENQNIDIISFLNWLLLTLLTISCVVGEEAIFRGILLSALIKHYSVRKLNAILASSLFFAGMHIVNIFSGESIRYTLVQALNAGATGFCLAVVCCLENSVIPGIVIHSLINLSSLRIDEWEAACLDYEIFVILPFAYALYGWYLYRKGKDKKKI